MLCPDPRRLLLLCAGLDLLGLLSLLAVISLLKEVPLEAQLPWVVFTAVTYLTLGWMFGSYTVLRWRRLPPVVVLQRVLITGVVTVSLVALVRMLVNPAETVWLLHRSTQFIWLSLLMLWSVVLRVLLRLGVFNPSTPQLFLVGSPADFQTALAAWNRTPVRQILRCVSLQEAVELESPVVLALAASSDQSPQRHALLEQLLERDPRETSLVTPLQLLERQLERLPSALVPDPWIDYQDLPWNRVFSLERQLKRVSIFWFLLFACAYLPIFAFCHVFDLA